MGLDVQELFKMSREELDELFTNSPAGEIPSGQTNGTGIIAPGTVCTKEIAECLRYFAWQGKVFDNEKGILKNRVSPFGVHAGGCGGIRPGGAGGVGSLPQPHVHSSIPAA